ncbi:MAG: hypothetical protein AAB562_00220 [Patescibacteria group bacterium]
MLFVSAVIGVLLAPVASRAVAMTSTNYQIFSDSLNVAGGRSTSTNFTLLDTVGELATGSSTSANFSLRAGFPEMTIPQIFTFSISTSAVSLGALTTTAVASGSATLTTSTSADQGYSTTIAEDGNLRNGSHDINDVTDGSVTAGVEEYGIRTSGTNGQFNSTDTAITSSPKIIAAYTDFIASDATTVTFKAAIAITTGAEGTYSHTVTFVSTGNF